MTNRSFTVRNFTPLLVVVVAVALWAVTTSFERGTGPLDEGPLHEGLPGLAGLELKASLKTQPPVGPGTRFVTSTGDIVVEGQVDERGYRLPLDVFRSKEKSKVANEPSSETERSRNSSPIDQTDDASSPKHPKPSTSEAESPRGIGIVETRLGADDGRSQNETSIDVDGSVLVAGWNNFTASSLIMGVGRSTDGGDTWSSSVFSDVHSFYSDPVVKSSGLGDGVWYYAYLGSPGPGGSDVDIYVRKSTDDGATWGGPVAASIDATFDDKPYIDAAGDEVVVGFADFGSSPARVTATVSTDGGATFGNQTTLATLGGNGACPVIDPDGNYHMFWRDSFQDSLWIATSIDQGISWSTARGIVPMDPLPNSQPPGYRIVNLPSADANPVTGELLVVWNDMALGDADILAVRSSDGGVSWSAPVRVNDDASGQVQFFPWVDYDENGVASVVWYDKRENGFDIDVYVAQTFDNGATFEPSVRVTESAFTPVLPSEGGAADFIGDYNGIAVDATTLFPFYQDSRRGEQDVYVARVAADPASTPAWPSQGEQAPHLVAFPSPFSQSTTLRARESSPLAGEARSLEIVSVSGQRVRALTLVSGEVSWDGRDDSGARTPAGVYFARFAGEATSAIRLVKLSR